MVTAQEPAPAPEPGTNGLLRAATNAAPDVATNVPPEPVPNAVPEPSDRPPGEPAEAMDAAATNAAASPGARDARDARDTRAVPAVPPASPPGARESTAAPRTNATARPRPEASRERPAGTAAAGLAPVSFDSFRLVVDRNIFDPNRTRRGSFGPVRAPRAVDSFSLVGTMSYGKGTFAFFDGSSPAYRKALTNSETIAGYKLTQITDRRVKLASGTNIVEMAVGTQLRREEEGGWTFVAQAGSYANSGGSDRSGGPGGPGRRPGGSGGFGDFGGSPASSGSSAGTGTPDPDVLKKLMERRAKEMNP
jgi:hypothetical protein